MTKQIEIPKPNKSGWIKIDGKRIGKLVLVLSKKNELNDVKEQIEKLDYVLKVDVEDYSMYFEDTRFNEYDVKNKKDVWKQYRNIYDKVLTVYYNIGNKYQTYYINSVCNGDVGAYLGFVETNRKKFGIRRDCYYPNYNKKYKNENKTTEKT